MERPNQAIIVLIAIVSGLTRLSAEESNESVLTYLRPYSSVEVTTTERGEIREIFVVPGQEVKKGEPLMRLDSEMIEARLEIAMAQATSEGDVKAATAEMKLDRHRLEIVTRLREKGTTNAAEYDRQKALLEVSEANLASAEEAMDILGLQARAIEVELGRRTLRSSMDGVVVEVSKDVGEAISVAREEALIRVVEIDRLKAKTFVPFFIAQTVEAGDKVSLKSYEGVTVEGNGVVQFVSPLADPATGTVEVMVSFDNYERKLPIGVPLLLDFSETRLATADPPEEAAESE